MSELAKDFICQATKKHPGDRPTVMEMLHHPWVRTFQRRTSVRIPAPRRQSSTMYAPGQPEPVYEEEPYPPLQAPAGSQAHGAAAAGAGAAGTPGGAASAAYNELTPEEIEEMIRKLQVAKRVAIDRVSNKGEHVKM